MRLRRSWELRIEKVDDEPAGSSNRTRRRLDKRGAFVKGPFEAVELKRKSEGLIAKVYGTLGPPTRV